MTLRIRLTRAKNRNREKKLARILLHGDVLSNWFTLDCVSWYDRIRPPVHLSHRTRCNFPIATPRSTVQELSAMLIRLYKTSYICRSVAMFYRWSFTGGNTVSFVFSHQLRYMVRITGHLVVYVLLRFCSIFHAQISLGAAHRCADVAVVMFRNNCPVFPVRVICLLSSDYLTLNGSHFSSACFPTFSS